MSSRYVLSLQQRISWKLSIFVFLLALSILSSCGCISVAMLVVGATYGGSIVYDHRDMKTSIDDKRIYSAVSKKISNSVLISNSLSRVSISVFNRKALIVGQVCNDNIRDLIVSFVKDVPNIRSLCIDISIEKPISKSDMYYDAMLTTKIKTALLLEKGLLSTQIKVVTENKVVYLMGIVSKSQSNLALNTIEEKVHGIRKIVQMFDE